MSIEKKTPGTTIQASIIMGGRQLRIEIVQKTPQIKWKEIVQSHSKVCPTSEYLRNLQQMGGHGGDGFGPGGDL